MNRNTFWGTFALFLLLILAGLVSREEASSTAKLAKGIAFSKDEPIAAKKSKLIVSQTEASTSQLVDANNRFGFELFARLWESSESQNVFISPQSVAIALAMTRNGTKGETLTEINNTLGLEEYDPATIDRSYGKLIETLTTANKGVQLAIANSLWVNEDIELKDKFIDTTQRYYRSIADNIDFAEPTAKKIINNWVASNTAHKIPQIVDTISPEDALYLINAVYFKGSWTKKFEPNRTKPQPFSLTSGTTKPVAMMSQNGDYRYYENAQFQAIRIPYGSQAELGMYVFLPRPDSSLEQFNQQLNPVNWQEWLSQMRSQPVNLTLPKFKLEYDTELKDVLSAMGIKQVFSLSKADFSAITDSEVTIDTIKHKAVVEVNEEGTEAAGVTSIGIRITSAVRQNEPYNMNIDRPFFFAIRDDITETILFMGNVAEP